MDDLVYMRMGLSERPVFASLVFTFGALIPSTIASTVGVRMLGDLLRGNAVRGRRGPRGWRKRKRGKPNVVVSGGCDGGGGGGSGPLIRPGPGGVKVGPGLMIIFGVMVGGLMMSGPFGGFVVVMLGSGNMVSCAVVWVCTCCSPSFWDCARRGEVFVLSPMSTPLSCGEMMPMPSPVPRMVERMVFGVTSWTLRTSMLDFGMSMMLGCWPVYVICCGLVVMRLLGSRIPKGCVVLVVLKFVGCCGMGSPVFLWRSSRRFCSASLNWSRSYCPGRNPLRWGSSPPRPRGMRMSWAKTSSFSRRLASRCCLSSRTGRWRSFGVSKRSVGVF